MNRKFGVQVPSTNVIFMGYIIRIHVSTINKGTKWITRSIKVFVSPREILMLQIEFLLRIHLHRIRNIPLIGEFRGIVGGLGYLP